MPRPIPIVLSIFALRIVVMSAAAQAPTQQICTGSPIPRGWVITDSAYIIGQCGSGSPIDGYANVQWITDISAMPIGTTVEICAGVPYPVGWVVTAGPVQNIGKCRNWGPPPKFTVQWIKRIS